MGNPEHLVIVGCQRCGTTYLSRMLDSHPEIEMAKPTRPEPKFFLDEEAYARGIDEYRRRFFSDEHAHVRGEKSTSYIESEIALQRLSKMLPDATVVVVLRDPFARAVSNYRFSVENGLENMPLAEALRASVTGAREWDRSRISVSPYAYLPRGRYAEHLERLFAHVPRTQVQVVVFEELVADERVIADLYRSLGVDASFRPPGFGAVVNASNGADETRGDPVLEAWVRDYFRDADARLAALLGRALPWAT